MSHSVDTRTLESAKLWQEDQCRDDLICIEQFIPKLQKQVEEARNSIGEANCELTIAQARQTVLDIVGLLGSAQGAHGKLQALTEGLRVIKEAE
jgi:hypothetical protein